LPRRIDWRQSRAEMLEHHAKTSIETVFILKCSPHAHTTENRKQDGEKQNRYLKEE
jgi:hypothetical protein